MGKTRIESIRKTDRCLGDSSFTISEWAILDTHKLQKREWVMIMGFLSTLFDILVSFADQNAKKVDRMSDSDIQRDFVSKNPDNSVNDYRDFAKKAHKLSSRRNLDNDGDDD